MAAKAYDTIATKNEASYTAFIQGISDISIKTKIHESEADNFQDAVRLAERLERVSKSLNAHQHDPAPIFAIEREAAPDSPGDTSGPNPATREPPQANSWGRSNVNNNVNNRPQDSRTPQYGGVGRTRRRCHYCDRENHVMRNCYQLRDDLNSGNCPQQLIDRNNNRHNNRLNARRAGQTPPAEDRSQ
jgi:hypothetical protein